MIGARPSAPVHSAPMQGRALLLIALLSGCKLGKGTEAPGSHPPIAVLPASYGENARPPAKECKFDSELTSAIVDTVPGAKADGSADAQLKVVITRVQGADPSWQGEMSVIVEGELSGAETRKFRFKRGSPPGVTGGMRGVCKGLEKLAGLVAEDIAEWVTEPTDGGRSNSNAPTEAHEDQSIQPQTADESEARNVELDEILE